ncbi:hypothetical protein GHT06_013188 [Daphnia sinensis]|uniref:Uncharacterized protein n=1 Tax=Daphnia sinensis TaxID=1820382 RepID=A0AAD5LH69_9CRUS|nr:hypothetical protein GHT06_013188 [Daphnia sinensis]
MVLQDRKRAYHRISFGRGSYWWGRDVNMGERERGGASELNGENKKSEWAERERLVALKVAVRHAVELNLVQRGIQTTTGDTSIDNKSRDFRSFATEAHPVKKNCKCDLILSVSSLHNGAMCSGC